MRSRLHRVDGALLAPAPPVGAPSTGPVLSGRVTGTCWFVDPATCQPVDGTVEQAVFTVTGFREAGGALEVTGTLTGTCTADCADGPVCSEVVTAPVAVVVTRAPGACWTLRVVVEGMDLDRRGLVVHTDEVVLGVTAPEGPGNLLGNLIAAVGAASRSATSTGHVADLLTLVASLTR